MNVYRFENRGRTPRAAVALVLIWGALLLGLLSIGLSPWIAGLVFLFTLPAAWEYVTDPRSCLRLDESALCWKSARTKGMLPLGTIERVRLDTRLDLSVRATVQLHDGRRVRLPPVCTPPAQPFEAALRALGIATERHHFALFG